MKTLAIAKNTLVMDWTEFKDFVKGKELYHSQVYWIEKWSNPRSQWKTYIPYHGFLVSKKHVLKKYGYGYSDACLASESTDGRTFNNPDPRKRMLRWFITLNEKNHLFYVTSK